MKNVNHDENNILDITELPAGTIVVCNHRRFGCEPDVEVHQRIGAGRRDCELSRRRIQQRHVGAHLGGIRLYAPLHRVSVGKA